MGWHKVGCVGGHTTIDVGVQSISPDAGGESIFTDCEGPTNWALLKFLQTIVNFCLAPNS